ncbi:MAG: hypothetical protein U0V18_03810 [Anaerolineales bacterium]
MVNLFKKLNLPNKALKILTFLLMGDLFYIFLHLIHKAARHFDVFTVIRSNNAFAIYYDLSLGESYQYLKEYWIILVFLWLIFRKNQNQYLGWFGLFLYMLLDDMLSFHEGLATFLLQTMKIDPFHVILGELRYQDYGELGVSVFFGVLFVSLLGISYFRGSREVKSTFHYLLGGLMLVVFFGVFTDFVNRVFTEDDSKMLYEISRLIEDGGEMLSMSIMSWYVYTLTEPDSVSELPEKS